MVEIRMFVDEGLGHSSYLIDLHDGAVAVLDPPRFPTEHIAAARTIGAAPRWTIDTHSHADYVTGSPALVADHDVAFVALTASRQDTPHHGIGDGDDLALAPGHGERAMTAASILARRGHRDVTVLDGGPDTWAAVTGRALTVDR